jgi:hypothetical protein
VTDYKVRIDDWPWVSEKYVPAEAKRAMTSVCRAFNTHGVPFILGVIPAYLTRADGEFLSGVLAPYGRAVQHGWDHRLKLWPHENFEPMKRKGGELFGTVDAMRALVERGDEAMRACLSEESLEPAHYIAPFNTYSQAFVDGLQLARGAGREYFLHTCDKEYDAYGYAALNYGLVRPVVAKLFDGYNEARKTLAQLRAGKTIGSPAITLHWVYDLKYSGFDTTYFDLAKEIACRP